MVVVEVMVVVEEAWSRLTDLAQLLIHLDEWVEV